MESASTLYRKTMSKSIGGNVRTNCSEDYYVDGSFLDVTGEGKFVLIVWGVCFTE